jgi:hypothetical protein
MKISTCLITIPIFIFIIANHLVFANDRQTIEIAVEELISAKAIEKIVIEQNEVYVNPVWWHSINIDDKKIFAWSVARYVAYQKNSSTYRVYIYDYYSGKKLAYYSSSYGFEVY